MNRPACLIEQAGLRLPCLSEHPACRGLVLVTSTFESFEDFAGVADNFLNRFRVQFMSNMVELCISTAHYQFSCHALPVWISRRIWDILFG